MKVCKFFIPLRFSRALHCHCFQFFSKTRWFSCIKSSKQIALTVEASWSFIFNLVKSFDIRTGKKSSGIKVKKVRTSEKKTWENFH